MKTVRIFVVLFIAAALAACRRETDQRVREKPGAPPAVVQPPRVEDQNRPGVSSPATVPKQPVTKTPAAIPFRVCALLGTPDAPRVGLMVDGSNEGLTLRQGQSYAGYKLQSVDFDSEKALFIKDGAELWAALSKGEPLSTGEAAIRPTPGAGATTQALDFSQARVDHYEATPAEKAAGIDPNDAATWPAGYRGPGIERAAWNNPAAAQTEVPRINPAANVYEPTPEETAAGINPNDSKTWPANYRGPGIERAMKASPNAGQPKGPKLELRPEDLQPSQGLGRGIEEALRQQNQSRTNL